MKISPKAFNEPDCKNPAPAVNTKKPTIVFAVPLVISSIGFFCKANPISANRPTNIAGVDKILIIKSNRK